MNFHDVCLLCEFVLYIILFFAWVSVALKGTDENNMDEYDRYWGISGKGLKRSGIFGTIYRDGEYDFWANLMDHNPVYN